MRLSEAWQRNAGPWSQFAASDGLFAGYHWERFLELVPPPGHGTLDLGCGEGRVGRRLSELGHRMVGVDVSAALVALARDAGGYESVVEADAAALPFDDERFDLVVAFMSLQDIDDMEAAVVEAARVLDAGGRLVAAITHPTITAGDFLGGPHEEPFALVRPYFEQARHVKTVSIAGREPVELHGEHRPLETYSRALEQAGFVIESIREPAPDESFLASHAGREYAARLPLFLDLRAVKHGRVPDQAPRQR
jgi:SAM-dependent methyltransferase